MKRIFCAAVLAVLPSLGLTATLDANYEPTNTTNAQVGLTYSNLGQSFTALNSGTIESVELKLYRFSGSSAGDAIVDLYSFSGTFGASLGSTTVAPSAVNTSPDFDWVTFDFTGLGIDVVAGTQYGIGLYDGGAAQNNQYVWNADYGADALYAGGSRFSSGDDGATWTPGTADFAFRVNLDPSVVPLPASLPLLLAGLGGMTLLRRKKAS